MPGPLVHDEYAAVHSQSRLNRARETTLYAISELGLRLHPKNISDAVPPVIEHPPDIAPDPQCVGKPS